LSSTHAQRCKYDIIQAQEHVPLEFTGNNVTDNPEQKVESKHLF